MISGAEYRKNTNKVMKTMIVLSFLFHFFVFIYLSGLYRSEALSYIELTMKDVSKPSVRSIPRPRRIQKVSEKQGHHKVIMEKHFVPRVQVDPVEYDPSKDLMAKIEMPDIPGGRLSGESVRSFAGIAGDRTPEDYFSMLRLKIENRKKYPESSRRKHHEGIVKVGFVITSDGQLSSLKIIKGTRYAALNQAALNAVKDAAPFSCPPPDLKGRLRLELNIIFELM